MNCGRENSRRSEMRENASQAEMLALRELAGKAIHIAGSDTQTIHARVNLQVELDGLGGAARRARRAGSGALEKRKLLATGHRRGQTVLDDTPLLARPEAGHQEDGILDARFAQLDAFGRASDAKPFRAGFGKRLGGRRGTVALGISFDDSQNLSRLAKAFAGRVYVLADGAGIVRQRGEIDFRPDRPPP